MEENKTIADSILGGLHCRYAGENCFWFIGESVERIIEIS